MTTVNFNDNRQNPIQTMIGVFLVIAAAFVLFGVVPGFLIASLVDIVVPLKTGPIWAISLLSTAVIIYLLIKRKRGDTKKALANYTGIAAALTGILIVLALITQGDIFFGFTANKMFAFLNRNSIDYNFKKAELERGRLIYPEISYNDMLQILNSSDKENQLLNRHFNEPEIKTDINNKPVQNFDRDFLDDRFEVYSDSSIIYYSDKKTAINKMESDAVTNGFLLNKKFSDENMNYYQKDNDYVFIGFDKDKKEYYAEFSR